MKIVKIQGGLGNQMFGYAIALTLKTKFPDVPVKLDLTPLENYQLHNGFELYNVFDCPYFENATPRDISRLTWYCSNPKIRKLLRIIMPRRKTECIERPVSRLRKDAFTSERSYYYDGYWQWGGYYDDIKDTIIDAFKFKVKDIIIEQLQQTIADIQATNSVGIHVRRGDYLTEKLYKGICDIDYYERAMGLIENKIKSPVYYVFSNDLEWCRNNIAKMTQQKCIFVKNEGKYSYLDMYLMTLCKNLIIANSSFSWWAAYLNASQNVIVSPHKWVNLPIGRKMQRDNWILI